MEAKTLKVLFDNGGLASARVEPYLMADDSWTLTVITCKGEEKHVTVVRTKNAKVYKSMKAVLSDVKRIGFNRAEVYL